MRREYSDSEIRELAFRIRVTIKENIKERVRMRNWESINIYNEIDKAWEQCTDYGRIDGWKWATDADREKLDEFLSDEVIAQIYEELEEEEVRGGSDESHITGGETEK